LSADTTLKKTPLFAEHERLGARIIEFGGWAMPVQYTGIIEEHQAVRERAGLFDVSHMGEILISGPRALELVNYLITNDAARLAVNQVLYTPMCNEQGGIIDDLLVYRLDTETYLLVVNAANTDKDWRWVEEQAARFSGVEIKNTSTEMAQLALQGPLAQDILGELTASEVSQLKFFWAVRDVEVAGVPCLISRTGYTGEDGFELYCPAERAVELWRALLAAGEPRGLVPVGLGARDTLRFEACLPLYGNELDETTDPLAARLGYFVRFDKGDFIGRQALLKVKEEGPTKCLVGFELIDRGIPRHGYAIYDAQGEQRLGVVTSGAPSPTLGKPLGLGYVPPAYAKVGTELTIQIRNRKLRARTVRLPFYKRK